MTALEKFALAMLAESREFMGDLDGGWLQDQAEALGLLVRHDVNEPCGESCSCAEYGEFPQFCLRYSVEVQQAMEQQNG